MADQKSDKVPLNSDTTSTMLPCHGRPCVKCHRCCDWFYDGDRWRLPDEANCTGGHGEVNAHGVYVLDICQC